jgi:glycopeptide antibiotics resistance protein
VNISNYTVLTRKHFSWITAAFILFVIYGSLIPLETRPLSWSQATARYQEALTRGVSFESRSDWLANILLFIPLGFAAMGTLSVDRREINPLAIFGVLVGCLALSAAVEFCQLWFPARVTSINDVVAETFGGVIGIGFWMLAGQWITNYVRSLWSMRNGANSTAKWIPGYLILLILITGMPFDLTISPGELKHKYVQGRVLVSPFTMVRTEANPAGEPLDVVKKAIINFYYFLPAGVLLAGFRGRFTRNPFSILILGICLAGAIEMMQLLIYSRYCDVTDILTGSLAVLAGWAVMKMWLDGVLPQKGFRWILLAIWVAAMVFINGEPFRFVIGTEAVSQRWHEINWIPFDDYYERNYLNSFEEMLQKLVLFIPLGVLLPGRTLIVAPLSLLIAAGIETGQLFLKDHNPSISDVVLGTIGATLGKIATWGAAMPEPTRSRSQPVRSLVAAGI